VALLARKPFRITKALQHRSLFHETIKTHCSHYTIEESGVILFTSGVKKMFRTNFGISLILERLEHLSPMLLHQVISIIRFK
jgi:hypothetical protein